MIAVCVRVDHVLDRLVGQGFHFGHNVVVIPIELAVDQNHPFVGQIHGDVAAFAQNHVEIILDLFELRRRRRLWILCTNDPDASRKEDCSEQYSQPRLHRNTSRENELRLVFFGEKVAPV